jgi:hypothetical protein
MATQRIESGRVQMASVGGVPMQQITPRQIDYTTAANVQARGANQLAQVIDRMSQNAFQMAGELAKQAAMEDVANTPLTPEQLEAAKNGDMSQLGVGGSPLNIYSATMRKARSFELASAFDVEAKAEVVKILSDVENGTANSQQAATKLNTMTKGFSQSLAQVDPDAALKFTASMGVYANTVMAEAYKSEQKRNKEKQGLLVESNFTNTMKMVELDLARGFYVDAEGVEQPIEQKIDVYRKNISDSAFAAGGLPMANQYLTKFDAAVAEGRINAATKTALGDEYMADPVVGLQRLMKGDLGRMSGIFLAMPQDDKSKVVANFMVAVNQRESAAKAAEENQKQAALAEFVPLYNQAIAMPGNSPQRKQLIAQLTAISNANPNVVPITLMGSLLKPDSEGEGNEALFFNLREGIWNGSITDPKQISSLINKGITGKQANTLLEKFISTDQSGDAYLGRGISRLAGIPVIPGHSVVVDPKGQEFKRRQELEADAAQISAQAIAEGKPLTPRQVLDALTKQVEAKRNSEGAKQARDSLAKNYETKPWINGPITRDGLSALERKAGNDRAKLNDLKRIRELLNQAEGN